VAARLAHGERAIAADIDMDKTSVSLLDRARGANDAAAWDRLVSLYTPLIRAWLRRQAAPASDDQDLVQEVMTVVVRRLAEFEHNGRPGAFRTWLRSITVNCLRDFWRAKRLRPITRGGSDFQGWLDQLADSESALSKLWDRDHDVHVMKRIMEHLEPDFAPNTWRAFRRVAIEGASPDEVAGELGMSVNAVFIAKSRVLARLRQETAGLIDE